MALHPTIEAIHKAMLEHPGYRPMHLLTAEEARAAYRVLGTGFGPGEEVGRVEDRSIAGPAGELPLRVYHPRSASDQALLPVFVYLHGGGWVIGDLESHDRELRTICNAAGCLVVSVDYRLAPEHPAPAACEDAWAALCWVAEQAGEIGGDAGRIALGGDSAGGNLAAGACVRARAAGGPVFAAQVLIYPSVATHLGAFASHEANREAPFLTWELMRWFRTHYYGSPDVPQEDPLHAPLLAELHELPPALVIVAEQDPLHDEGVAYAEKLGRAGTAVRLIDYAGMSHAFIHLAPILDDARAALDEVSTFLREAFARGGSVLAGP